MGWIFVLLPAVAAYLFYSKHLLFMVLAIITAVGAFWSLGVMHNYATNQARRRLDYKGGFYDLTEQEVESVPNWLAAVNMAFSILGIILLVTAFIF